MMRRLEAVLVRQRWTGEYTSILGLLNYYVMGHTPWRLARLVDDEERHLRVCWCRWSR